MAHDVSDPRRLQLDRTEPGAHGPLRRIAGTLAHKLARGLAPTPRVRTIDGVRYRHIGGGQIEAAFPSGEIARVRPGPERTYHDLEPDPRADAASALAELVRPGDRVLILGSGTGAAADTLARAVGDTGAAVALEHDGESVRYARRRYPHRHCAHEIGGWADLAGELDGAFDAALICEPQRAEGDRIASPEMLGELARVLRGGDAHAGGVAIAAAMGPPRAESIAGLLTRRVDALEAERARALRGGWGLALLTPRGGRDGPQAEADTEAPADAG